MQDSLSAENNGPKYYKHGIKQPGRRNKTEMKKCRPTTKRQAKLNQSRTNGPINAHLTTAQVMPKYNHNEKQEALL